MSKILFIEDDDVLAEMYHTRFAADGFDVEIAIDGEQAVDKLKNNQYDLIMLDLMLPKLDGFQILEKLRASGWPCKDAPVIVFSNLGQGSDIEKAKDFGANDYLIKAMHTPNEVVEKVKSYLK